MKKKFLLLIFTCFFILLGGIGFAETLPPELKEIEEELLRRVPDIPLTECHEILGNIYDLQTVSFFNFLDTHFQNKSSTSSLMNIAIARYSQYKRTLEKTLTELAPKASVFDNPQLYQANLDSYLRCSEMTDTYIALAKERLIQRLKDSSQQKRTTMLLEKYKTINSKLRDLNRAVAQMYGYFLSFKNKFPCYTAGCITQ